MQKHDTQCCEKAFCWFVTLNALSDHQTNFNILDTKCSFSVNREKGLKRENEFSLNKWFSGQRTACFMRWHLNQTEVILFIWALQRWSCWVFQTIVLLHNTSVLNLQDMNCWNETHRFLTCPSFSLDRDAFWSFVPLHFVRQVLCKWVHRSANNHVWV